MPETGKNLTHNELGHTVGAEINGLRVPAEFHAELLKISEIIPAQLDQKAVILGEVAMALSRVVTEQKERDEIHDKGIFDYDSPNFEKRFQPDYDKIRQISETLKTLGHKIVLTSGTYDLLHVGHAKYLSSAKSHGDFLIVGVDSDKKVKSKKGEHRPVAPEIERLTMLAHVRGVDVITLKNIDDPRWHLIKTVRPDTLIATEGTYTEDQIEELHDDYVGRVVVLPPQAETSTSARVRKAAIGEKEAMQGRLITTLREMGFSTSDIDGIITKINE